MRAWKRALRRNMLLCAWGAVACTGEITPEVPAGEAPRSDTAYVRLAAGRFMMGCDPSDLRCEPSERPRHAVHLTRDVGIDRHEITVADFRTFVTSTGHVPASRRRGRGRMWDAASEAWVWQPGLDWEHPIHADSVAPDTWPAVQIDARDAAAYCRWRGGRLPTEAEWEYAARGAGQGPPAGAGNGPDERLHARIPSWEFVPGVDDGHATLAPVMQYAPNGAGLHDMLGNAYEWTADAFGDSGYVAADSVDPAGAPANGTRVVRGGSWGYHPFHHRVSWRGVFEASEMWTATLGARCAHDLSGPPRPELWYGLRGGPHHVGFAAWIVRDPSRRELGGPRRVLASAWFPTAPHPQRARMPFGAYVALYGGGVSAEHLDTIDVATALRIGAYRKAWIPTADSSAIGDLLRTPTAATLGATPLRRSWPLLLYAPGLGGTPLTHTITAEWLASQGYIVVSVPATGGGRDRQTYDIAGQSLLADDMALARQAADERLGSDDRRVAAIGFSFGANVATLLAARDARIQAVVSLDGSLTFRDGYPILTQAPDFSASRVAQPLLVLLAGDATAADTWLVRHLSNSPRWLVAMPGLEHHDLVGSALIASHATDQLPTARWRNYETAMHALRAFLQGTVGDSAGSLPRVNGALRRAVGGAATVTWLRP